MMLLRRCVEAEMIGGQSKIDIIFTKKDILETSPDKGRALPFVDEIKAEILSKFMGSLGTISFFSVAARPTMKPILGETYGFKEFLPAWIDESPFIRTIKRDVPNTLSENSRMFLSSKLEEEYVITDVAIHRCSQLLVGLPDTGKSTFLAALYHQVEGGDIKGSLVLERLGSDIEYLNRIREDWLKCEKISRATGVKSKKVQCFYGIPTHHYFQGHDS